MSEGGPNGRDEEMEDQVEHVLREGLRAPPLSPEALARIRAATLQEWQQASGSRAESKTSRRALWGSLAAVLFLLVRLPP